MNFKDAIGNLAGPGSTTAILLLVLCFALAGAPHLEQKQTAAKHIGFELALARAQAIADALLAHDTDQPLDSTGTGYRAHYLRHAATPGGSADALAESPAVQKMRSNPQHVGVQLETLGSEFVLHYAVPDRRGGVLLLDVSLDKEMRTVGRFFGQSYLSDGATAYTLIGLLLVAAASLRHFLRRLAQLPPEQRRQQIQAGLTGSDGSRRRNLLPWLVALCGLVFLIDVRNWMDSAVGIGYLLAVMLGLSSNRSWHSTVIASIGVVMLFIAPVLSPIDSTWWTYLQNHAVTTFALIVTGLFGSAHLRKTRAETIAQAEAAQSRHENLALREALERAEAAESERREVIERMSLANRAAVETTLELQRQTEHLREIEARLERASLSSMEGHWEYDIHNLNALCWCSSSFAKLTGYDPSYLATLSSAALAEFTHVDDRPAKRAAIKAHLAGGPAYDVPVRLRMANGDYRWFQLRGAVERDSSGKARRAAGSIRDIHQQKIAEDLLREAQLRFERAVSGTQDALFDYDLRSGERWRSPRYYEMLGYQPSELGESEHSIASLIHGDDAVEIDKVVADHLQHNKLYDVQYRIRHKEGRWIWVRERAKAERDASGKPIRIAGSIRDVTEYRKTRDAMAVAAAEAEAASRAKSTFLATMSHEIRTPMNGVIGMTGLLLDTGLDRVQRDYAETIRASADSLLTILNDILDFSKIEAGKLDIESLEMDLTANVDEVGAIMAFQAAAKGLELVVNVRPEVPDRIFGDPQRIRQCLLNLVGNAIKFTQSGEVVLEVCSLGQQDGRSLVHFEVRDTGIGIPPETINNLFQPFAQADSSTTRKFGGTGLGLSIVRKLVEMMGGQTGAQSEPGKGSTFWFTLPLETVITSEEQLTPAVALSGKRVLLVDDNETNRRVLSSQMNHSGYSVDSAASAEEALTLLRNQTSAFDVIVLDYHMPEMDGAMLGEYIMKARDIPPTRLMLLTSLDRSGDMQRFADIGFSAYLTKPVRARELLDCLDKTLSRNIEHWHLRSQPIITRGTLIADEGRRHYAGGKVLLVEDNAINQRVARRFLERLGCEVHVVSDGAQAVAAYEQQTFGFILMDMQMPIMDGIEATRRIRELEKGAARTPIVALTANAMMGTLERCLDAGMDDYLTKPLDISRLQDVLDRFFGNELTPATRESAERQSERQLPDRSSPPLEPDPAVRARLTDIAGDDHEFAAELVNAFVTGGEQSLHEMRAAVVAEDRCALAHAAHKLKGASANLHVDRLTLLASHAETCAKTGKDADIEQALQEIATEFARQVRALQGDVERRPPRHAAAS